MLNFSSCSRQGSKHGKGRDGNVRTLPFRQSCSFLPARKPDKPSLLALCPALTRPVHVPVHYPMGSPKSKPVQPVPPNFPPGWTPILLLFLSSRLSWQNSRHGKHLQAFLSVVKAPLLVAMTTEGKVRERALPWAAGWEKSPQTYLDVRGIF